jgi:hypothetical protein
VHLIWVRVSNRPTVWDLLNGQLVVNSQGGPPPPAYDERAGRRHHQGRVLDQFGFDFRHADLCAGAGRFRHVRHLPRPAQGCRQAERMWNGAKALLQEAMTRHDQQKPKRAMFNSRMTAARRIRRPWPRHADRLGWHRQPG